MLTAIKTDQREIFYDVVGIRPANNKTLSRTHMESEDSGSSLREGFTEPSGGTRAESEDSRSRLPKGSGETSGGTVTKTQSHDAGRLPEASKQSIAQTSDESKRIDEPVKKTVRFQLSESRRNLSELQKESRELERQRRALKEERANWLESSEVRAIEENKKAYGLFSERGKAFRASEEYQSYLEKRKEFNRRGAELESRIGEVNDKLRQAQAEVENARQAVKQEQQKVYDAKPKRRAERLSIADSWQQSSLERPTILNGRGTSCPMEGCWILRRMTAPATPTTEKYWMCSAQQKYRTALRP